MLLFTDYTSTDVAISVEKGTPVITNTHVTHQYLICEVVTVTICPWLLQDVPVII